MRLSGFCQIFGFDARFLLITIKYVYHVMVLFGFRFFMVKEGLDQLVSVQNRTKRSMKDLPENR